MRLYNTLTRKKEKFKPITVGVVKMYSCGPTVYNYFHIGNARPFIVFDTLRRYFEYKGYKVEFIQNFTDIDDKMINNANEQGITVKELGDRFISEYFRDAEGLGIKEATYHPKATENIDIIIETIKGLEEKGVAYNIDGDVYFSTKKFSEYGKLSKQKIEDLEIGARIETDEKKKDAMDFALWKKQKPGEPAWDSPWGKGRPGWHIECSAMANKYLGSTIDIHSGGQDLIFPHHENEIAQSECLNGVQFANYWLHNGYINVDNKKMSKSLNNFFTVRDISKEFSYEVIRFFMLSAHYRSPVNFSKDLMEQSKSALDRIYTCVDNLKFSEKKSDVENVNGEELLFKDIIKQHKARYMEAMDDDINTAGAISVIFDIVKDINTFIAQKSVISKEMAGFLRENIKELAGILGLLQEDKQDLMDDEIQELITQREQARKEKNWTLADKVRDELKSRGIILEDTPKGVKVVKK